MSAKTWHRRDGLLSRVSYRVGGRVVAGLVQACIFLVLARTLGPSDFGIVVLGQSIGAIVVGIFGLGLPNAALRVLKSEDPARAASATFSAAMVVSVPACIASALALTAVAPGHWQLTAAAAASVAAEYLTNVAQSLLAGVNRQRASVNLFVAARFGVLLPVVASHFLHWSAVPAFTLANAATYVAIAALGMLRLGFLISRSWLPGRLGGFWLYSLASLIANLDLTVVRLVYGAGAVGIYGAAARLSSPLGIAVGALLAVLVPAASQAPSEATVRLLFGKAYRVVGAISIALVLLSYPLALLLVKILGPEYRVAFGVTVAVVCGVALSAVSQVLVADLMARDRVMTAALAVGCGSFAGLGLVIIADHFGAISLWTLPLLVQGMVLLLLLGGIEFATLRQKCVVPRLVDAT